MAFSIEWISDELIIEAGNRLRKETDQCGDSWTDSELAWARAYMASKDMAAGFIPLDALRRRLVTLRKGSKLGQSDKSLF